MYLMRIATGLLPALLLLTGCGDDIHEYRGPADSEIPFSLTGVKKLPAITWSPGDQIGVFTTDASGSGGVNTNVAMTIPDDGLTDANTATFSGALWISTPTGTNHLYAYYPYLSSTSSASPDALPLPLNATQTMTGMSYDSRYAYMYASSELSVIPDGTSLDFSMNDPEFKPVTGFINITGGLDDSSGIAGSVSEDDEVQSVSITVRGQSVNPQLAGSFTIDLTTGETDFGANSGTANTVTVNCASGMTLGDISAWLVVNPFSISGTAESAEITVTVSGNVLVREFTADELSSSVFSVTAGNVSRINILLDDSWILEDDVEGKVKNLYLVKNNVGPHTLTIGWEETDLTSRNYIAQIFDDRSGSPLFTSPTLTYKTNNTLYSGTYPGEQNSGYGPTRFTFTELEPNTTYYMRVKHAAADDSAYSNFLVGTTEPEHTTVAGEVLYQGFDKLLWSSDPMNSASGVQPTSYNNSGEMVSPTGWDNLTTVVLSDGNTSVNLVNYGAMSNPNDYFGLYGWRYSNTNLYPMPGYLKLGSSSANGSIRTPAMGSDVLPASGAECTLTFRACPFVITPAGTAPGYINVFVVHSEANDSPTSTTEPTDITNILSYSGNGGLDPLDTATGIFIGYDDRTANYQWRERTLTIPNLKPTDKIWFKSEGTTYRFLLDEITVVMK